MATTKLFDVSLAASAVFAARVLDVDTALAAPHPGYIADRWYLPLGVRLSGASVAQAADSLYVVPIHTVRAVTVKALGARILTGVASTQARLAVYSSANGRPKTLLGQTVSAVSGVTGSTDASSALAANVTLDQDAYWLAALVDGAMQARSIGTDSQDLTALIGASTVAGVLSAPVVALSKAQSFAGGFPADLAGAGWSGVITAAAPAIAFQVA